VSKRKYLSEFGLGMRCSLIFITQQDGLHLLKQAEIFEDDPLHIYMICRRPRVTLNPETIEITPEFINLGVRVQYQSKFEERRMRVVNNIGTTDFTINCPFPHIEFEIILKDGSQFSRGKVANLMHFTEPYREHLDLEVLYIGQSFGVDGARYAPERLSNHSTLQGIYAEAIRRTPDKEIWLLLCSFQEIMVMSFDGASEYQTTLEEDDQHMFRVLNTDVSLQQKINFTEAALIRYFRPEYNQMFKNNFPNPAHTTYSECYDIEINQIHVEIDTEDLGCRLWSPSIPPNWVHIAAFPLWSKEDRKDMFKFDMLRDSESFIELLHKEIFPDTNE
jgi:hypothetical protein